MKVISVIMAALLLAIFTLPSFANSPVITDDIQTPQPPAAQISNDYFVLIIVILCLSVVSLVALLVATAIMRKKK